MPKIHFVYAGDPGIGEIRSPYCITKNVYNFLKNKCIENPDWGLTYHDWCHVGRIDSGPDDIIIGHPNYPPDTIIQQSFRSSPCRAKFTIHPIHTKIVESNMPFDHLIREADGFFGICGPYWYDTMQDTPFAHWKPKMTRLDMAVDTNHFPFSKEQMNPVSNRKLLYIGSDIVHKNLAYLCQIMEKLPDQELFWYGGHTQHALSRLPNVKVTGNVTLNADLAKHLCNTCDLMVNVSSSDANPTTLLETSAWGLPVACTPSSGYYGGEQFYEIPENNPIAAANVIRNIINMPSEELDKRRMANFELIRSHYTWDNFCNKIWDVLKLHL